jgi:eukaryotic-like serine/threonine-protein kinase
MECERWQQLERVCQEALDHAESERAAFLNAACAGDGSLLRDAQILLGYEKEAENYLEVPALLGGLNPAPDGQAVPLCLEPRLVFAHRFVLIRQLGEGGMGQVWLAEQTSPVRRQVALKLIKSGFHDESAVQRFQAERQSLAIMEHPAIAKVFEAGTTELGQPYLVMEFVPGLPITEYCDQRKLKIADRLELFIQVCEGVQHAHQKAIIHRDLKPANILVVEVDGKAVPRIIDFGVAKATAPHLGDETFFTQVGHFVGTLGYISPEQTDPNVRDIDTRTDVYSLGAVLYVLLAGARPFDTQSGEKLPLHELLRKLREEEPPSPSTKVSSDRAAQSATAESRGTEPKQLANLLRGDLDWITMKAIEKDRARRCATPLELAADIRRYLNHESVSARPASTGYRLRKYIQRHQALVAGVATVFLVLLAGAAVSTFEAIRARQAGQAALRERDLAQRRFDDVHKMAREVIFNLQKQLAAIPGTTQVRRDLAAVAINYLDALANDATADKALQGELVGAYLQIGGIQGSTGAQNLGDLPAALASYSKAERLARTLVAQAPSSQAKWLLMETLMAQAQAAKTANQLDRAATNAMEALSLAREHARSDPASKDAQFELGSALQCAALYGTTKDRIPFLEEEASVFERMLGRDPNDLNQMRNVALAHKYVAGNWITSGDFDRALTHLKRAEELDETTVRAAPNNPERRMAVAIDLSQWAEYYESKRDFAKAIQYSRASLAIRRELASADPKDAWAHDRLSYILTQMGDLQMHVSAHDALASYRQARSIAEKLPIESLRTERLATSTSGMADAYRKLGDVQHSCAAYAESMKLFRDVVKSEPRYGRAAEDVKKSYSRCPDAKR